MGPQITQQQEMRQELDHVKAELASYRTSAQSLRMETGPRQTRGERWRHSMFSRTHRQSTESPLRYRIGQNHGVFSSGTAIQPRVHHPNRDDSIADVRRAQGSSLRTEQLAERKRKRIDVSSEGWYCDEPLSWWQWCRNRKKQCPNSESIDSCQTYMTKEWSEYRGNINSEYSESMDETLRPHGHRHRRSQYPDLDAIEASPDLAAVVDDSSDERSRPRPRQDTTPATPCVPISTRRLEDTKSPSLEPHREGTSCSADFRGTRVDHHAC